MRIVQTGWRTLVAETARIHEDRDGRILLVMLQLFLAAATLACANHHHVPKVSPIDWHQEFDVFVHSDGRFAHEVLVRGEGPPVLLLHELPGAMNETLALAMRLARDGFRVYLPILFGKPGEDATMRNTFRSCGTREFDCLSDESAGAIVGWLRDLSREIHEREPGRSLASIGMCLTGSIPLELAADPWMVAPVLSQPALPLFGGKDELAVSPASLACVRKRALPVLYFRYSGDPLSRPERLARLETALPGQVRAQTIDSSKGNAHGLPEDAHAVLSSGYVEGHPEHPGAEAYATLVEFLGERLAADGASARPGGSTSAGASTGCEGR